MNYIWYELLLESLRHHIEANHMNEKYALDELKFLEEHLAYSNFGDGEKVEIGCPWSQHCKCNWTVAGVIHFKLDISFCELTRT